jgi:hypothetical protein
MQSIKNMTLISLIMICIANACNKGRALACPAHAFCERFLIALLCIFKYQIYETTSSDKETCEGE